MERRQPTERAKEALVDELRDAVGDERVDRADVDVERAVRDSDRRTTPEGGRSRLLFVLFAAAGVMVAAIAALALESWIVLVALLALHAVLSTIVITTALRTTTEVEKPAPTTVALLEDEGVDDPEGALNRLVDQVSERDVDPRDG